MSAISTPFGFIPVYSRSGDIRPEAIAGGIASGYSASLYIYTPVQLTTTGVLNVGGTTGALVGVFAGCSYTVAGGITVTTGYWPANTTYNTGSMIANYYKDDGTFEYRVQANGSLAQTSIGDQANTVNPGNGNAYTALSTAALNSTLVGASSTGQWQIVNLEPNDNNAWGDAFTVVRVRLNQNQLAAASVAAI